MTIGQSPEERDGLLRSARMLAAEAGVDGGAVLHPELAERLVRAVVADVAAGVRARAQEVESLDDVAAALVDGTQEAAAPWADALPIANSWLEHLVRFEHWSDAVAPWLEAVEDLLTDAQRRGLIRADLDPSAAALVLRDVVDRSLKASTTFGRQDYRATTLSLVRAALRS